VQEERHMGGTAQGKEIIRQMHAMLKGRLPTTGRSLALRMLERQSDGETLSFGQQDFVKANLSNREAIQEEETV
jgi:hypothetical protein